MTKYCCQFSLRLEKRQEPTKYVDLPAGQSKRVDFRRLQYVEVIADRMSVYFGQELLSHRRDILSCRRVLLSPGSYLRAELCSQLHLFISRHTGRLHS